MASDRHAIKGFRAYTMVVMPFPRTWRRKRRRETCLRPPTPMLGEVIPLVRASSPAGCRNLAAPTGVYPRMRALVTFGGALLLLAACGRGQEPQTSGWAEPGRYAYTLRSSCGERLLHGTMRLTVEDGKVTTVEGLDEAGGNTVQAAKLEHLPSLKDLIIEYETAVRDGADKAVVEFDPGDGHPTRIDLDPQRNSIDDEACYWITDYRVLE